MCVMKDGGCWFGNRKGGEWKIYGKFHFHAVVAVKEERKMKNNDFYMQTSRKKGN